MYDLNSEKTKGLNTLAIRIIAVVAMLCDHMWITVAQNYSWLAYVGRIAFPLFAFLLVEGFYHSKDRGKYFGRLFFFAIISELPFNLMHNGTFAYSLHQNVLWTLMLGLLAMMSIDAIKRKIDNVVVTGVSTVIITYAAYHIASSLFVDYLGFGILTVILFYTCRNLRYAWIGQLTGLIYINVVMMRGPSILLPWFWGSFELPLQALATLSLLILWQYSGAKGPGNNISQLGFYLFYPLHMLLLALLALNNIQLVF
jgi:hypothetical protein